MAPPIYTLPHLTQVKYCLQRRTCPAAVWLTTGSELCWASVVLYAAVILKSTRRKPQWWEESVWLSTDAKKKRDQTNRNVLSPLTHPGCCLKPSRHTWHHTVPSFIGRIVWPEHMASGTSKMRWSDVPQCCRARMLPKCFQDREELAVCLRGARTESEGRRSCPWALPGPCWSPTACSASLCCGRRSARRAPSRVASSAPVRAPWGERRTDGWLFCWLSPLTDRHDCTG